MGVDPHIIRKKATAPTGIYKLFGSSQKGKQKFLDVVHLFSYLQFGPDTALENTRINHLESD